MTTQLENEQWDDVDELELSMSMLKNILQADFLLPDRHKGRLSRNDIEKGRPGWFTNAMTAF
jgi:hypothetical protein